MNVTVPVVTGEPPSVTVAVNVTALPVWDGFADEATVVVVEAAAVVVIVRLQPPLIVPTSPDASSTTYSCHVPLGLIPVKAPASVVCADGLGAGLDWKTSLQELCATLEVGAPTYAVTESGPDHAKQFEAVALVGDQVFAAAGGRSKKQAEQGAAKAAFEALSA